MRGTDKLRRVGKRIEELRLSLGLSQNKFAEGIKVSRSHVGRIEKGTQEVNDRIISLICMTYNVSEKWLREGKGAIKEKMIDKQIARMNEKFRKLDVIFQEFVVTEINKLLVFQDKHSLKK